MSKVSELIDGDDIVELYQGDLEPKLVWPDNSGPSRETLARCVAKKAGLLYAHAMIVVDAILGTMTSALQHGDNIEVRGFGSLRIRQRRPRTGRNPMTGATVPVPERKVIYFTPGKEIKKTLTDPN